MGRYKKILTDLSKLERSDEAVLADEEKINQTIKWLKDILYHHEDLVALSAPQIGVNMRLFCIKFADGDIRTFANPLIVKTNNLHLSRESSISIPGKEFIIPRYNEIEAVYQTPVGKIEQNLFKDAVSDVFQQMVQLLDGITLETLGLELVEDWDSYPEEERQQVIDMYLESLQKRNEFLQEEIKGNPELKQINDAIDFMTEKILQQEKEQSQPHYNYKTRRKMKQMMNRLKRKGKL